MWTLIGHKRRQNIYVINFQDVDKIVFDMFNSNWPQSNWFGHKEKELLFYVGLAARRKGIVFHEEVEVRSISVYSSTPYELMLVLK